MNPANSLNQFETTELHEEKNSASRKHRVRTARSAEEYIEIMHQDDGPACLKSIILTFRGQLTLELCEDVYWTAAGKLWDMVERDLDRMKELVSPRAYFFTIARNEALSVVRQMKKLPATHPSLDEFLQQHTRHDPTDKDDLERLHREFRPVVLAGLRTLSPQERLILALSIFREEASEKTATKLGLSAGHVRRIRKAAMERLTTYIKQHYWRE